MALASSTNAITGNDDQRPRDAAVKHAAGGAAPAFNLRHKLWTLLICLLGSWQTAAAETMPLELPSPRTELEEVWTISSRQVRCGCGDVPRLEYWRFDHAAHRWMAASHEAFLAGGDPATPTCVFVHGNRIARNQAFDVGWHAYQSIKSQCPHGKRFRFLIWSWPSTRIAGQLKDVRAKAARCDVHSLYLAWLLDQMHPESRVCLIGYSYGARLIAGSLHLLGGGRLAGRSLASRVHPNRQPIRAVLMAAAVDSQALLPHARNGRALSQVDRMLVMTNPTDKVLKFYRLLYGLGSRVRALGAAGATGYQSHSKSAKVRHWNVSRFVGEAHDWTRYLMSPAIVSGMKGYALFLE